MRRLLYGPPNWIVEKLSSEDRRMVAFWIFVIALVLYPFLGAMVFYVSAIGLVGMAGIFTSETPTETEDE